MTNNIPWNSVWGIMVNTKTCQLDSLKLVFRCKRWKSWVRKKWFHFKLNHDLILLIFISKIKKFRWHFLTINSFYSVLNFIYPPNNLKPSQILCNIKILPRLRLLLLSRSKRSRFLRSRSRSRSHSRTRSWFETSAFFSPLKFFASLASWDASLLAEDPALFSLRFCLIWLEICFW